MDRQYWDSLANHYQDDLLEISREDRSGVLTKELKVLGGEGIRVADLGCGPGSLLPFLVANFGEVIAVDYAEKLLGQARQRCRSRKVRFVRRDLSRGQRLSFKVEVVCCINALIDPDRDKRRGMLRSLRSAMSKKGLAVIVVPALESVFHVYHTLRMIREREGAPDGIDSKEAELMMGEEVDSFPSGIIQVGGYSHQVLDAGRVDIDSDGAGSQGPQGSQSGISMDRGNRESSGVAGRGGAMGLVGDLWRR